MAVTALVMGAFAFLLSFFAFILPVIGQVIPIILGLLAVMIGAVAVKKTPGRRGIAIAGIGTGAFGFIIALLLLFFWGIGISAIVTGIRALTS